MILRFEFVFIVFRFCIRFRTRVKIIFGKINYIYCTGLAHVIHVIFIAIHTNWHSICTALFVPSMFGHCADTHRGFDIGRRLH